MGYSIGLVYWVGLLVNLVGCLVSGLYGLMGCSNGLVSNGLSIELAIGLV